MVKLIVWDLDGIIWSESLAESNDIGQVNFDVVNFIKQTEQNGIIHSVCSKNVLEQAKLKLKELDIWEYFIFPELSFEPKGPKVKSIIKKCNLREDDVLFVDDNSINICEVKFFCPKINTEQNTNFIKNFTIPIGNSRTNQYKILEQKLIDSEDKSNLDFLKDSNINIAIYACKVEQGMEYFGRVTELVNRSNQLNFTKSRIEINEDALMPYAAFTNGKMHYVFCWDKYGYYGLIGFFGPFNPVQLKEGEIPETTHFVFSCRIMNMGIENFCSQYIKNKLGWKQNYVIENEGDYSYIKCHNYKDIENFIREKESLPKREEKILAMVDSGCQAATIVAFTELDHKLIVIDFDYTFKTINGLSDMPKLYVVSAAKFMGLRALEENILDHIDNMFRVMKEHKKIVILLIAVIKNFENESLKKVYDKLQSCVDNKNVFKIDVPIKGDDYSHWSRDLLFYVGEKLQEWLLWQEYLIDKVVEVEAFPLAWVKG